MMLIIRILVCCLIYMTMKDFSNTFVCGFWANIVMDLFMAMTKAEKVEG